MVHDHSNPTTSGDLTNMLLQFEDLLDWERESLVQGDLEAVMRILSEKERMMTSLTNIDPDHKKHFEALLLKAERNQQLLNSALEGIRVVMERISVLRKIRTTLETYDQNGQKKTIGSMMRQQVEKRA